MDVKDKFIRNRISKFCVYGEIHIRMKPTAVEIMISNNLEVWGCEMGDGQLDHSI